MSRRPSPHPGSVTPTAALTDLEPDRRTFLRGIGGVAALLAVGGAATACSSSSDSSGSTSSGSGGAGGNAGAGKTIGISLNGINAYSTYVAEGVMAALAGTKYKVVGVQNNFNSTTELSNIQNLLTQGIDGLVVLPADATTIGKAAQLCSQQGVPVGNALWPGKSAADKYYTGVADLDSVAGGKLIGEYLKKNAKPGKVIVVQGIVGQGFSEKIDEGLNASLAGSGFTVAVRQQAFFDRNKATGVVESGLQAHPDTTAIVAYSASMSDGIASYLKSKKITDLTHVSSDGDDELFTWLGTPYLQANRYYSAAQTGSAVAKAVRAKIEGGSATFDNPITQAMITKSTATAAVKANPYRYKTYAGKVKF
ncbi:ribose transport system substrate-binding protein [Jatrophihabitans endophyticus]|uniref:Ribose transport system substrate-binding protein n=1 Tax=Jatrophihabitans endophyticus TaxID=1206085 RepID=A0A1M5P7H7_9ACTN|nr:sugar ABC transporter substrate-binding protein [Jatrophihabitans endophyticus]SHG97764.1 ribose transport system substrate-binding protein [Jatrophihabitans endophyticus]